MAGRKGELRTPQPGAKLVKFAFGILLFVFGCRHRSKSSVFTIKKRTYQVCLECGREFDYSLARMRSVRGLKNQTE